MAQDFTEFPPAKITDRFIAYLIDFIPFAVGYYGILYVYIIRLGKLPNTIEVWSRVCLAWLIVYLLYQLLGNMSGGTFGKRFLGIGVIGKDGGTLGFGRSLVRSLGYLVSTPCFNFGFLWSLVDRDSRTFHDIMAGSRVVELKRKSVGVATLIAVLSFVLLGAALVGDAWFHLVRLTPEERNMISRAEEGLAVMAAVEETYKATHGTYTDDLMEIARLSGDVKEFREAMLEIFDPDGFVIYADKSKYILQARALDPRRTPVRLEGPKRRKE
ncbi:RDD family protein [Elusimicrobiota bacterium]